ncbi:hypothetical protein DRQ32_09380, partial [bacterium]
RSCFDNNASWAINASAFTDGEGNLPVAECWWGAPGSPPPSGSPNSVTTNVDVIDPLSSPPCEHPVAVEPPTPSLPSLALSNASPNPFNPRVTFQLSLPEAGLVDATVFDARGRRVRTLLAEVLSAGPHVLQWNGKDTSGRFVASGVYYLKLQTPGLQEVRTMTLVR